LNSAVGGAPPNMLIGPKFAALVLLITVVKAALVVPTATLPKL